MYKQILCPIDGSPTSDAGMNEAIHLAKDQNAKLRFLHIIDIFFPIMDMSGDLNEIYIADILRKNGTKILNNAEETAHKAGVTADTKMVEAIGARISKFILSEAEEWPADLIIMGTHGLRGFERLIMGSDVQAVIKASHVPVLLVKNTEADKSKS
jgi:nucleotide-binding universal stress UspA family protein